MLLQPRDTPQYVSEARLTVMCHFFSMRRSYWGFFLVVFMLFASSQWSNWLHLHQTKNEHDQVFREGDRTRLVHTSMLRLGDAIVFKDRMILLGYV